MRNRALTRCLVLMSSAGGGLLLSFGGCAQGESDDGGPGVTEGDGALEDAGADRGIGPASDASGGAYDVQDASGSANDVQDASGSANDVQDTSDAQNVPEGATDDAIAPSDAVADTSFLPDASTRDGAGTEDASIDATADVVDAAVPIDASCTTTCGVQALCISGVCTPSRRVFVSTEMFTGNLGGTSGADNSCHALASAAQLGGSWKAWVSDGTTSPSTRFTQAAVGYRLLDGTLVATNWTGLVSGALLHGIDLTEQRTAAASSEVWTGTLSSGVAIGSNVCDGFTSSANGAPQSVVGNTSRTDIGWSNATSVACDVNDLRIYCMEQ
jgi:hypothetical protein